MDCFRNQLHFVPYGTRKWDNNPLFPRADNEQALPIQLSRKKTAKLTGCTIDSAVFLALNNAVLIRTYMINDFRVLTCESSFLPLRERSLFAAGGGGCK